MMDRPQAIKILQNPKSSKAVLKEALSFALGVEYEPDTKEKKQTVFNQFQKIFCDYYTKETGLVYAFTGQDGKAITDLIDKVQCLIEYKSQDEAVVTFEYMMQNLPEWYKQKAFSLPVINKKFNDIVSSIKLNGSRKGQSNISDSYKQKLYRDLQS